MTMPSDTCWTTILQAADPKAAGSLLALETLCRTYWVPLYGYARSFGKSHADAEDTTQAFFQRLIEKNLPGSVAPRQGSFRSFLLVAMRNFIFAEHRNASTQKRGGTEVVHLSIDDDQALAAEIDCNLGSALSPEAIYEQQWAQTMVKNALDKLAELQAELGQGERFTHLRPLLLDPERGAAAQNELVTRHGMSEGSIRTALSRLRAQFRQIIRDEVAKLVDDPADIDDEIAHMLKALR